MICVEILVRQTNVLSMLFGKNVLTWKIKQNYKKKITMEQDKTNMIPELNVCTLNIACVSQIVALKSNTWDYTLFNK